MCLVGVGFHCLSRVLDFGAMGSVLPGMCAGGGAHEHVR